MVGVFLILLSITIPITDAAPTKTGCGQISTDIFFLMDSSSSIQTENFADQLKFVADVVNKLDMKMDGLHVGLATFSDSFYLNIDLTDDKNSFLSSLSSVFPLSGSTRIGRALYYLQREGFENPLARKNAQKVAIIITDGESVDNPFPIAEELKLQGMKIFAIEAKYVNNKSELRLIASKPSYRFLFNMDARNVGKAMAKIISNIGCSAFQIRDNCQQMQHQDFRFLIDTVGLGRLKSNPIMKFTIQAIHLLGRKNLNAGFGIHSSYSSAHGNIHIQPTSNVTAILQRFDHLQFPGPQGIITSLIQHPEQFNLEDHKKKMIVIFIDESSEPLRELKLVVERLRAKDRYVAVFIIAIGRAVRKDQAREIASERSLFLHIPNIDEIENSYEDFTDILCNPQDYSESLIFHNIQ